MQRMVDDECHSKKRLIFPIERTKGCGRFEQNGSIFALLKREYQENSKFIRGLAFIGRLFQRTVDRT